MQAICLDCTTRFNKNDKAKDLEEGRIEFYQVWSHSLSVDYAKSVAQKTIPGDALFFYQIWIIITKHEDIVFENISNCIKLILILHTYK